MKEAQRILLAPSLALLLLGAGLAPALAAKAPPAPQARTDIIGDFRTLAQQRPWTCPSANGPDARAAWPGGSADCAWQNRLRHHGWTWTETASDACPSTAARWWSQAQAALPAAAPRSVWDRRWTAQALRFSVGAEQRLLLLRRAGKDGWQADEWRWNPNPRPATRRWQEARWQLLLAALKPQAPDTGLAVAANAGQAARLRPVLARLAASRPAEFDADGMAFAASGLCLQAGNPLPGQPRLHLSYSPNDSRLEQRTAMHLQLSRQFPDAKWLTQFRMLDMPAGLPSGAKFIATRLEGGVVVGQLWMPLRDDAATVRVRVTHRLAPRAGDAPAAAAAVKPVIERELETIAREWATRYE